MSYRKYDSRMSQRYLNQNLIVSLTKDFLKIRPQRCKTLTCRVAGWQPDLKSGRSTNTQKHSALHGEVDIFSTKNNDHMEIKRNNE